MSAVNLARSRPHDPRQQGIRLNGYCVRLLLAAYVLDLRLLVLVRCHLVPQQVLIEGAFMSDVQHLNAATDAENRQAAFAEFSE